MLAGKDGKAARSSPRFLSRGSGYTLFLTATEAALVLRGLEWDPIMRGFKVRSVNRLIFLSAMLVASSVSVAQAGIDVWTSNGPDGGGVQTLAIDAGTPTTLYAGTDGGGVFKSTDGGTTWSAVNTGLTSLSVPALAIDPQTPTTV